MKALHRHQRRALILWTAVCAPFVAMGLLCGCGTLMDNHAPPVAKQVLQGVDMAGSGVAAVVWSPLWVPDLIRSDNPDDLYGMYWTGGPVATTLFKAKLRRHGKPLYPYSHPPTQTGRTLWLTGKEVGDVRANRVPEKADKP